MDYRIYYTGGYTGRYDTFQLENDERYIVLDVLI